MLIDMTTPVGAFGFEDDRAFPTRTRAEFERTTGLNRRPKSFIRIEGRERGAAAAFRRNPYVEDVTPVVEGEGRSVYRLRWGDDRPQLLRTIDEEGGRILSSAVTADALSFEVRFPNHAAGSRFYARYDDRANPITIRRSRQNGHSGGGVGNEVTPNSARRSVTRRRPVTSRSRVGPRSTVSETTSASPTTWCRSASDAARPNSSTTGSVTPERPH